MASILVVDDDGPLRAALLRALRSAGHTVDEAANGTHALAVIEAEAPDVLLTDIIMANGDGIELISAVRRSHAGVRVIAMSGRGSMGQVELLKLAQMLGADAVLPKPFEVDDLLAKITSLS